MKTNFALTLVAITGNTKENNMGQRQFDMENPTDVEDLFNILPDFVVRIEKADGYEKVLNSRGAYDSTIFFRILWGNKTSVDRPVDKSKWIGCLCWFWDGNYENRKIAGILKEFNSKYYYPVERAGCEHCRPVKRSEIKFVEDND